LSDFLDDAVECFVILDRDYRPQDVVSGVEKKLAAIGVVGHVWDRKELESYLLSPDAIARLSGAPLAEVKSIMDSQAALMENAVFSRMLDEKLRVEKSATAHAVTVTTAFKAEFDMLWKDVPRRLEIVPPKQLLSAVNKELQLRKFKAVSFEKLASSLELSEIPAEMRGAILRVETALSGVPY
jgi:hypothetical protein